MSEHFEAATGPAREGRALPWLCAVLGVCPVASLLAWIFHLGPFAIWFWALGAPSIGALIAISVVAARNDARPRLKTALAVGTAGGIVGTLGYDLFRIPFAAIGFRVFAPIDSYGVLLLGASSSSPRTSFAGWLFHFSNGIGFGIAFACVALGARWWWGLAWGLTLETVTVITPFAKSYGLHGGAIAIAYAAHVAYGVPLGLLVQSADASVAKLKEVGPGAPAWMFVAVVIALTLWLRPFATPDAVRAGERVAPGPSAVVRAGRFEPEWLRVAPGRCITLRNDDARAYTLTGADGAIAAGQTRPVCFSTPGIARVTLGAAYSGGFVIVDKEAA